MLEGPELGDKAGRRRLEQRGNIDVVGAEADAVLAHDGALRLVEGLDVLGHLGALQRTQRLDHAEGDAAGEAFEVGGGFEVEQRLQQRRDVGADPEIEAVLHLVAGRAGQLVVGQQHDARRQGVLAGDEAADGLAEPAQRAVGRLDDFLVGRLGQLVGALLELEGDGGQGGGTDGLGVGTFGGDRLIRHEAEPVHIPDGLAFDKHGTGPGDFSFEHGVLSQSLHKYRCTAIHETLGQPIMQRIRQTILYRARTLLPMDRRKKPVRPVGDKGPGADVRQTSRQHIDIAVDAIRQGDLAGKPIIRNHAFCNEESIERDDEITVLGRRYLAEVGNLADIPQQFHPVTRGGGIGYVPVTQGIFERALIVGGQGARQTVAVGRGVERFPEAGHRGEIQVAVAPLKHPDRFEIMGFDGFDDVDVERSHLAGDAERAVVHVAAGPAGDLGQLGGGEAAILIAVELAGLGEGDVVDVEVEAHADGVGGDEEVDVAVLEQGHLGVAGARRQGAHHHGGAAALAADQFGDGVDLLGREGDDGRTLGQAGDLALAGVGEGRQARPRRDGDAGNEPLDERPGAGRAEQQRLVAAADVENAVGEDVAALGVAAQLHFVDGDEGDVEIARHGLDGGHPVAGAARHDLFLAGDQRHGTDTGAGDDAAVDLARQQAQRQADGARPLGQQALDGEMRLARIGRTKQSRDRARPVDLIGEGAAEDVHACVVGSLSWRGALSPRPVAKVGRRWQRRCSFRRAFRRRAQQGDGTKESNRNEQGANRFCKEIPASFHTTYGNVRV